MYFKKLELIGFKSFSEKTTLQFEPGITAIVGPNGCGKCVAGSTNVTLADGTEVSIRDLVESALRAGTNTQILDDGLVAYTPLESVSVLSLNPGTLKIEPKPVYAFVKRRSPESLLTIKTRSGRSVTATPYHPLFSIKNSSVYALKAEELKPGVRIAVPRNIPRSKTKVRLPLLEILQRFTAEDSIFIPFSEDIAEFIRHCSPCHSGITGMAEACGIPHMPLKSLLDGQSMNISYFTGLLAKMRIAELPECIGKIKSRGKGAIRLPQYLDSSLARFLGYIISEGSVTPQNHVWFVNADKAVVKDFIAVAHEAFGVEARAFSYTKGTSDVLIFSHALCKFLEKAFGLTIGSVSAEKRVPAQLFSAPPEIIADFLSALFEGDGYLSCGRKGSGTYFEYSSASLELAEGVRSLLLRLGILSVVRASQKYAANTQKKLKRTYYSVFVYGAEHVSRFASVLHFSGAKSERLARIRETNLTSNPNLDVIPEVNDIFKSLVKLSGLQVKKIRRISPKLASYYENRCCPSRQGLKEALNIIAEHGELHGVARAIFDHLKRVAEADIYWDEVVSVKRTAAEEWVYDLSIRDHHNFLAGDMIVHNSNIFDSIRWVLGEQSAKSLRGTDMQDVIFNGTDLKEPLGLAEVTLAFDNTNRFFGFDADEIAVTRRLYRSGESEYLLNKSVCRLKDITDLFAGTGVGAESYSIVAQGKIDLILSSRPEDRRLVFDEASGITKYKSQKRETMRKLEETELNLARVNDIVVEVKRQINSLERQAQKARRYKEAFEELKTKELYRAVLECRLLNNDRETIAADLRELTVKETELAAAVKEQETTIAGRQTQLQALETELMGIKNELLTLENAIVRDHEHIRFNKTRIDELTISRGRLNEQLGQIRRKIALDEEKVFTLREEYNSLKSQTDAKAAAVTEKETELNSLVAAIKGALEEIAEAKKRILDVAAQISHTKNEIAEITSKQQVYGARQKRLQMENAKVSEEEILTAESLKSATREAESLKMQVEALQTGKTGIKKELENASFAREALNTEILRLERERLTLESHKEFLDKLKTKYEDIGESMNAVIYLDKLPADYVSGLVVKIGAYDPADTTLQQADGFKLNGEAKPIELDTTKIDEKIARLQETLESVRVEKQNKERLIEELNLRLESCEKDQRSQEIASANKETSRLTILEQFNKIKEEHNVIVMETADVERELAALAGNLQNRRLHADELAKQEMEIAGSVADKEHLITQNTQERENCLMAITQGKAELNALHRRVSSDEATLRILEDTYRQDQEALSSTEQQIRDITQKTESMGVEMLECETRIASATQAREAKDGSLRLAEEKYRQVSLGTQDAAARLEADRQTLAESRNSLYDLQMKDKDIEYKAMSIKSRLHEAYKVEMESAAQVPEGIEMPVLTQEITHLKSKIDSYGTVNLVAIEEYDELKKRYDFLLQQQTDLTSAKDSLHQAIQKINKTTKQIFIETFERVREEFKTYFRVLFNGGDAQIFLTDESDPLESGIEIICRPPGKKLQNVLLLSGGEKSMSAIALIFAIFKVKPSPFCVLDEIDAALDESNVDRLGKMLQEFAQTSQFIVITHNKKTIANADLMYGITMQESGVSKIVSVKFGKNARPAPADPAQPPVEANPPQAPIAETA